MFHSELVFCSRVARESGRHGRRLISSEKFTRLQIDDRDFSMLDYGDIYPVVRANRTGLRYRGRPKNRDRGPSIGSLEIRGKKKNKGKSFRRSTIKSPANFPEPSLRIFYAKCRRRFLIISGLGTNSLNIGGDFHGSVEFSTLGSVNL